LHILNIAIICLNKKYYILIIQHTFYFILDGVCMYHIYIIEFYF